MPAALLNHLAQLASSIGRDIEILQAPLRSLVGDLRAAVPSYRGLRMIIVHTGQPVTLTDLLPTESDRRVLTSLRMPLGMLGPDHDGGSRVIFFAGIPGAFVDLAADLGYALAAPVTMASDGKDQTGSNLDGQAVADDPRGLLLDADLTLNVQPSGLTGLAELSAVSRALGMLIDRGHDPGDAYDSLLRAAAAAGVAAHVYAARMLGR
jgi:hypothetical protein